MKRLFIIMGLVLTVLYGCHEKKIGYLVTKNAEYIPDSVIVHRILNPDIELEATMIQSGADWTSNAISGVLGTAPLFYSVERVTASGGGDADLFMKQVKTLGNGQIYFPSKDIKAPDGTYVLSIRVSNEGYTALLEDVIRFVIREKGVPDEEN